MYDMIYKWYVKWEGKFSKKNSEKKENDDYKYKENSEKKKATTINNSILYDTLVSQASVNRNLPHIKL